MRNSVPLISGVSLSSEQVGMIERQGGRVLWQGNAGHPHGAVADPADVPGLFEQVPEAEVWYGPGLSAEVLSESRKLRWLQTNSAGVEGFLTPEVVEAEITVTNMRGMHSATAGEHTLALMLALARGVAGSVRAQSAGDWVPTPISAVAPLAGTRLVIVGTGAIGQAIAQRAAGFGMDIVGVSRTGSPVSGFREVFGFPKLQEVVRGCDWLVIACPLTKETRGMISREVLASLPPGAIVVNIARGAIVDEEELVTALEGGRIWGAGLDVFVEEPLPATSRLWRLPNVLLTPHAGGAMRDYGGNALTYFLRNLERYRDGRPLESIVDKRLGY